MINLILWLVMGAFVGWIASLIMKTDAQQGTILNIVVGIVGAAIGGFVSSAIGGRGLSINNSFSVLSVLISIGGAVLLLGIVKMVRGTARA